MARECSGCGGPRSLKCIYRQSRPQRSQHRLVGTLRRPTSSRLLPLLEASISLVSSSLKISATMLRARSIILNQRTLVRTYASASSPHALVLLEHRNGSIENGSLSALSAAQRIGGDVTGILVGSQEQVPGLLEKAKKWVVYYFRNLTMISTYRPPID